MEDNRLSLIKESGIVAIIRGVEKKDILKTTNALIAGGVKCIEVTFNTLKADEMISDIRKEFGKEVLVGAGTVTDEETAKTAYEAGAEFILSPSLHKEVIVFCKERDIISVPGAYTPTEVVLANKWGGDIVKIFPAGIMDPKYIKMLSGPLDDIHMMAVGGIDLNNTEEYIKNGCICVGVGSSLVNKEYIIKGEYKKLSKLAQSFITKVNNGRNP